METDFLSSYKNKKILITGHTGFKGSWLSYWLSMLEAEVYGYALEPNTPVSLYDELLLDERINSKISDIRDFENLKKYINEIQPDIIFHLAAQSLVLESYINPLETIQTNVTGTANVLDAVRQLKLSTNIVVITSDKCYDNKEWLFGYRENDPMGGYDPYSVSKGAAELIVSAWRRSYFNVLNFQEHGVKLASARAGNVIGGGDWAENRIVPDCMRALKNNTTIEVRNPLATRPWQHVLEPLGGYLLLGHKLLTCVEENLKDYCSGFNFGPFSSSNKNVESLVHKTIECWGSGDWTHNPKNARHEAFLLNLTIDKAYHLLGWKPIWDFNETVRYTTNWYKENFINKSNTTVITEKQIQDYSQNILK